VFAVTRSGNRVERKVRYGLGLLRRGIPGLYRIRRVGEGFRITTGPKSEWTANLVQTTAVFGMKKGYCGECADAGNPLQ
jgi:hypothetical protein